MNHSIKKQTQPLTVGSLVSQRLAILLVVSFLVLLGLVSIYSSSSIPAAQRYGSDLFFLQRQLMGLLIGVSLIALLSHCSLELIEKSSLLLFAVTLISLILVIIPGVGLSANGATRWLRIAGFSFQPAEFAKVTFVMIIAKNLSRKAHDVSSFKSGLVTNLFLLFLCSALLLLQPDFGTVAQLVGILFAMLYVAGISKKVISIFVAMGTAVLGYLVYSAPYRMARILSFLDPWSQVEGSGFQIIQSYLGFQNGGLFGVGLGESKQKLGFLPEAHTDFILSVIGEELGLIGVILVCSAFAYLSFLGMVIAFYQKQSYRKYLAFGMSFLISSQALFNMGVAMGLLPTKGVTLPFISNGSNSLIVFLFATGILARIAAEPVHHEIQKTL